MFAIRVFRESFHDDGEERIEGVEGAIVVLGHLLLLKVVDSSNVHVERLAFGSALFDNPSPPARI